MAGRYNNPFQGIDVNVPVEFHDDVVRFCQTQARPILDNSPFPRMVDMWFLAVCVAARQGLKPADPSGYETRKIIEGSIFSGDPWRVHTLMLLGIALTGSVDIVSEPRKIMQLVNGLAIAGMPAVIDMLKQGDGDPIWNLSECVEKLVRTAKVA
jgi:hypothetical protein